MVAVKLILKCQGHGCTEAAETTALLHRNGTVDVGSIVCPNEWYVTPADELHVDDEWFSLANAWCPKHNPLKDN